MKYAKAYRMQFSMYAQGCFENRGSSEDESGIECKTAHKKRKRSTNQGVGCKKVHSKQDLDYVSYKPFFSHPPIPGFVLDVGKTAEEKCARSSSFSGEGFSFQDIY